MNSYPNTAFYFQLSISGIPEDVDASFQEVGGLSNEIEPEKMLENEGNRYRHILPKQVKHSNLELKKGVISANSELAKWCDDTINGNLAAKISTKNIILKLNNENGIAIKTWSFVNAWPVKWNVAELKLLNNEIAVESIEFAYTYFELK